MNLEFHPVSNIFPLLQGEEFEALKKDIQENGLLESIWLDSDGRIIDGRNRYRACEETGTEPKFRIWNGEGSLVSFVISLNLHRRHLDSSQRAAVAAEILPMLEDEARERQGRRNDLNGTSVNFLTEVSEPQRASQQAAQILNTNRQYVSDAKRLKAEAPVLFEQVKVGELTIPKAKEIHKNGSSGHAVHFSSESNEWYTPQHIIDCTLAVFGTIDLDPCSNPGKSIPASNHFIQIDDGLSSPWHGKVYLNPPYGNEIKKWVDHLCSEYEAGRAIEAIALLPSRTDTEWFRRLKQYPKCFVWGRLRFSNSENSAPFPSMIVYLGTNAGKFIDAFLGIGDIYGLLIYEYTAN